MDFKADTGDSVKGVEKAEESTEDVHCRADNHRSKDEQMFQLIDRHPAQRTVFPQKTVHNRLRRYHLRWNHTRKYLAVIIEPSCLLATSIL